MKCLLICLLSSVAILPLHAETFRLSAYQLAVDETTNGVNTEVLTLKEAEALLLKSTIQNFIAVDLKLGVPNQCIRERLTLDNVNYTYNEAEQLFESTPAERIVVGDKLSATLSPMDNGYYQIEFSLFFDRIERWIVSEKNPLTPMPIVNSSGSQSRIVLQKDHACAVGGLQHIVVVDGQTKESGGSKWFVLLTEVPEPEESV